MVTLRKQMRAFCLMCQRYINTINNAVKEQVRILMSQIVFIYLFLFPFSFFQRNWKFLWSAFPYMLKCCVYSRPSLYCVICYWSSVTKLCLQAGNSWSLWSIRQTLLCRQSSSTSSWIMFSLIRMMTTAQVRKHYPVLYEPTTLCLKKEHDFL